MSMVLTLLFVFLVCVAVSPGCAQNIHSTNGSLVMEIAGGIVWVGGCVWYPGYGNEKTM